MLRILHTADLHLGLTFGQLEPHDATRLARARLSVVDSVLGLAEQYNVDAVLCAGDLFDTPDPDEAWWRGFAEKLARRASWTRPVILLPGNHDPLIRDSVYDNGHPFRRALPAFVHVVDRDSFELAIGEGGVVFGSPCRSTAGADDLAMQLPARTAGDSRIRIGLVHGSTFDLADHQTNFPIARDAAVRRGLDYLAIGDTHGFREIPEGGVCPTVYPGAPESTSFKDRGAGAVVIVTFRRSGIRPTIVQERVGRWTWREETVRSLPDLQALASEDLGATVLRLRLDLAVPVTQQDAFESLVALFRGTLAAHGRAGACVVDRSRLRIEMAPQDVALEGAPETVRKVAERLALEAGSSPQAERALVVLYRLHNEARRCAS